jgi:hypothetical protein
MNDARMLYLKSYFRIDCMNHMIKRMQGYSTVRGSIGILQCCMGKCLGWLLHMADMYLEVAKGNLMPKWKLEEPLDFWQFWEQLAKQMLAYKPSNHSYPGDSKMRAST